MSNEKKVVQGSCAQNPRRNGHCMHTRIDNTIAGTVITATCCWCRHHESTTIQPPEHGPHA